MTKMKKQRPARIEITAAALGKMRHREVMAVIDCCFRFLSGNDGFPRIQINKITISEEKTNGDNV